MKAFTDALGLSFEDRGRIQFTPDLMPADITGTLMPVENDVTKLAFQAGPIFRSILLADEINRATPKTQSAMLEAMAEKQVTVLGKTRRLPLGDRGDDPRAPFMVIATQNPIDQEGTYELPEAQTDRFMFKFLMNMPPANSLREIVERETGQSVADGANLVRREELLRRCRRRQECAVAIEPQARRCQCPPAAALPHDLLRVVEQQPNFAIRRQSDHTAFRQRKPQLVSDFFGNDSRRVDAAGGHPGQILRDVE
nr:AAA family ATPase [Reyranella massiliensis]